MNISWQPLVSIVTPSYNQAQFLWQTIESVKDQDYTHIEHIVMDGGSADGSVEIICQYEDGLAYWTSQPDNGQADAINRGWQRSHGEILAWLNSDDTYASGAISAVVEVFRRHPEVDVVTGDCHVIDEAGRFVYSLPSGNFDVHAILAGNSLPQQGVFCRRSALEEAGWLDIELNYVFDWALWLKLWLNGARFDHLPRVVANFRVWGQAKTASDTIGASLSGGVRFARERLGVLAALLELPEVTGTQRHHQLIRSALLANLLELALLHHLADDLVQTEHYLNRFVGALPVSLQLLSSLPFPRSLAAHLAYLDGDLVEPVRVFVAALCLALTRAGYRADAAAWTRTVCAETYLVQAWHATHLGNNSLATRRFLRALTTNPKLLFQRRTVSPTVKYLLKASTDLLRRDKTIDFSAYESEPSLPTDDQDTDH